MKTEIHVCEDVRRVTCGACDRAWCERCDPAPSALCPWCNGRGYSTAPLPPIRTIEYGNEIWKLHADGGIERRFPIETRYGPSDTWKLIGAVERNNFGNVVRRFSLEDVLANRVPWKFKNGRQRCFARDVDHGTTREWRSPNHRVY